jgi:hypothetical protein
MIAAKKPLAIVASLQAASDGGLLLHIPACPEHSS